MKKHINAYFEHLGVKNYDLEKAVAIIYKEIGECDGQDYPDLLSVSEKLFSEASTDEDLFCNDESASAAEYHLGVALSIAFKEMFGSDIDEEPEPCCCKEAKRAAGF